MKSTKALRLLFDSRFLREDIQPKVGDWDARDEEQLNKFLADGTDWVVLLPTWVNPRYMSATWLIAHGLAVPYSFWNSSLDCRVFVFANAWREMFAEGSPYFSYKDKNWTRRLPESHRMPGFEGFKVFRWKASSQKATILSKMRRVYLEALEEAGSMSAVDTANCMCQGADCSLDYRALPASVDAIDKSLLFISTQLSWIRNPAFLRDSTSHAFTTPNVDTTRGEYNAVMSQYYTSDVLYTDMASIDSLMKITSTHLLSTDNREKQALPIINYYVGTQMFAWSLLHAVALEALPSPSSSGIMGDIAAAVFALIGEKSILKKYGVEYPSHQVRMDIKNDLQAFHAVTAFELYPYSSKPLAEYSYIKFAHTWLGQVSSRALHVANNGFLYHHKDKPIINAALMKTNPSYKAVIDYMESSNYNLRGANPASTAFTDLPGDLFPNIMNPEHAHSLLTLTPVPKPK